MKKKGILAEFKEFISRGNVVDMAVGVIIGSAFTSIVNSLVNDVFMPFIGVIVGGLNFENLKIVIKPAAEGMAETAVYYGRFIQAVVNFLIIAAVVFAMVKIIGKFKSKKEEVPAEEPAPPEPSEEVLLLREIRDSLKK